MPLWDTKKCKTIFLEDNPKSIVHEDMNLCAGEEGKDSCLVRSKAIFDNIFRNPCKVGTYNSLGGATFGNPCFETIWACKMINNTKLLGKCVLELKSLTQLT